MDKINIIAVKTNLGYYITDSEYSPYSQYDILSHYYFDGKLPTPTFHKQFVFISRIPTKIEKKVRGKRTNFRYELIDKNLQSDKIAPVLQMDDVTFDQDGEKFWKSEWKHLESLYLISYDQLDDYMEEVDFEFIIILELNIDKISDPIEFSYPIRVGKSYDDIISLVTNKNVAHQLIDKIIFPQVILHETPAMFTSKQVYDIVRHHIKQNIDMRYAKIVSDYDFCFEVHKILNLANPYYAKYEKRTQRGNSYKPPKYEKKLISNRSKKIFEMTHAESNYKGYSVIQPMQAENELALKEKMDKFLLETIEMINEPLVECKHCDGTGVVLESETDA